MSPSVSTHRPIVMLSVLVGAQLILAGCQRATPSSPLDELADVSTQVKFDAGTFGVPASPRVTSSKRVAKGGGRIQLGKPYKVRGKWYYPKDEPGYTAEGVASWYGPNFHGRLTANGEIYDMHGLSAAHKTFPLPSYAIVTNLENGNRVMVRVNDRGPFSSGREIDVSSQAADLLAFKGAGTADVKVDYVGRAPLDGDDTAMLMASYQAGDTANAVIVATAENPSQVSSLPGVLVDRGAGAVMGGQVSSYAGTIEASGAASAVNALGSARDTPERIALGLLDRTMMERVKTVALGQGTVLSEALPGFEEVSASVSVNEGADADMLLRRLWQIGATDAFVVRE